MIEWKHQQIAESVRLLKKCEGLIYPLVYERVERARDLWTAYIGPYYISIWSGDLFYTVQISGRPDVSLIAVDLGDAKWKAIAWIDERLGEIKKEVDAAWEIVTRQGTNAL